MMMDLLVILQVIHPFFCLIIGLGEVLKPIGRLGHTFPIFFMMLGGDGGHDLVDLCPILTEQLLQVIN